MYMSYFFFYFKTGCLYLVEFSDLIDILEAAGNHETEVDHLPMKMRTGPSLLANDDQGC